MVHPVLLFYASFGISLSLFFLNGIKSSKRLEEVGVVGQTLADDISGLCWSQPSSGWWVMLLEVLKGVQEYGHFCLRKLGRKMLHFPETVWVKLLALETRCWEAHPVCITQVSLFSGLGKKPEVVSLVEPCVFANALLSSSHQ